MPNTPDLPSTEAYVARLRAAVAAGDLKAGFWLPTFEELLITERAAAAVVDQVLNRVSE